MRVNNVNSALFPAILALVHSGLARSGGGGEGARSGGGGEGAKTRKARQTPQTRIFGDAGSLLVGAAAGVGATLLGQALLNKPNNNNNNFNNNNNNCCYNPCGRKKRQARHYSSSSSGCNNPCGRKKREAADSNTKLFGLFGGGSSGSTSCGGCGGCGGSSSCGGTSCGGFQSGGYQSGGYQSGGYQSGGYQSGGHHQSSGFNSVSRCSCNYSLSKRDNWGKEEAKCARSDHTGKRWCYTSSSSSCYDAVRSSRYPNNPWSYQACGSSG